MGGSASTPRHQVLCIGARNTGKTAFLNRMVYGSTMLLYPTVGRHEEVVQHAGVMIEFCELGGTVYTHWNDIVSKRRVPVDTIFVFLKSNATAEEILEIKSRYLAIKAIVGNPRLPVVYMHNIHCDLAATHVPPQPPECCLTFDQRNALMQSTHEASCVAVCINVMRPSEDDTDGAVITSLLDWVIHRD